MQKINPIVEWLVVMGVIAALFASLFGIFSAGIDHGIKQSRIEAVKSGHGEWLPQQDGTTKFRWVEK